MEDKNGELLLLALTARNSGVRASQLLNLSEPFGEVIALEVDFACTARLQLYDAEREQRQLEAMSGGLLMSAFAGKRSPTKAAVKTMPEGSF